jgi:hypothetical protein
LNSTSCLWMPSGVMMELDDEVCHMAIKVADQFVIGYMWYSWLLSIEWQFRPSMKLGGFG